MNIFASTNSASPGTTPLASSAAGRGLAIFFVLALLVPLGYSLFTEQIWEDGLITLRHGENLLQGHNLSYNAGERVHGFTSPLNVLLLTLCHLLTGQTSYFWTLWLYRLFTIAAFAGGGVLSLRALMQVPPRWAPALWFVAIAYLFDAKAVAFSTNGMETGFMLLLVALAVYLIAQERPDRWLPRGACWAALMWTRPDGCIYIVGLALAELIFLAAGKRRLVFVSLLKSAGLCALLYGPWFLWAWWYYGSPIPHTIIAKANIGGAFQQGLHMLSGFPGRIVTQAGLCFRPLYDRDDPAWLQSVLWVRVVNGIAKGVGVVCLLYWLLPSRDALGRVCSLAFAVLCVHFSYMKFCFPWYYPPATLLGLLVMGRALTMLASGVTGTASVARRSLGGLAYGIIGVLVAGQLALFALTTWQEHIQQQVIENEQRTMIGKWINERARPTDTLFLEPLGYIGYFSGLRVMDWPGLVSPEVVAVRRKEKDVNRVSDMLGPILALKPNWVVLRNREYEQVKQDPDADQFHREYHLAKAFDVNDKLDQYWLPSGEWLLRYDAAFAVFARNDSPGAVGSPIQPAMASP